MNEREQLEQAIAAQEGLRGILPDAIIEATISALRDKLAILTPASQPEQQRKQATILFADVSGFTAMSEMMDAEEVNEVMNALWERLDGVIVRYNGHIDKHIGDAIMALWGTDVSQENDVEQAIHAALAMQTEIDDFAATSNTLLKMRIGINTGLVLLGEVGTVGEFTAIGDAVNIASRLEHAAPVGGILISHDTYRHVRGIFDVEKQTPIYVKGKEEALQLYIVKQAKPRAFRMGRRGVEGVGTRMVGRETYLRQLQDAYDMVIANKVFHTITIVGEAGIGKSRLLDEFSHWLDLRSEIFHLFRGRIRAEMQNTPYALLRDVFTFRFQIQESDTLDVVWQKMAQGLGAEANGRDEEDTLMRIHIISHWLGFDFNTSPHSLVEDAKELHNRALMYLADYWQAMASRNPIVIFLDDIHWADDSSLNALTDLVRRLTGHSILLVTLTRPSLFEQRPDWGEGADFHTRLDLPPLSTGDSCFLVEEVLQRVEKVPQVLSELLVNHAEGNPFYMEELIKMLVDNGVIIKAQPHWQVDPTRLATIQVPATLTAVLQARLDRLSLKERKTLQLAAVVGRVFWEQTVAFLSNELDSIQISGSLMTLRQREMILQRDTSFFVQIQEYVFKHAILHQVIYESVLLRLRPQYHGRVAKWLINHSHDHGLETIDLIADHLEQADQTKEAIPYLWQAGKRAADRYANTEAINYFSRALDLLSVEDDTTKYELLLAREQIYNLQGERDAQQQDLESLAELADRLARQTGNDHRAEVALRLANYAESISDYAMAAIAAIEALKIAQMTHSKLDEAASYLRWGSALLRRGEYDEAIEKLQLSLAKARIYEVKQIEADSLRALGVRAAELSHFDEAAKYYLEALPLYQAQKDKQGESIILNNLGVVAYSQSELEEALNYWEEAREVHFNIGDREGHSRVLSNLSSVYMDLGDYQTAKSYSKEALSICYQIDSRFGQCFNLINLSLISFWLLDEKSAENYCQAAYELAQDIGSVPLLGMTLKDRGFLLTHLGQLGEAEQVYQQALEIGQELVQQRLILEAQSGLAQVFFLGEDFDQAQTYCLSIVEHLRMGNSLEGTTRPFDIYLICYKVLKINGDRFAQTVIEKAYTKLQKNAAKMSPEACRLYLENVSNHREIMKIWQAMQADNP